MNLIGLIYSEERGPLDGAVKIIVGTEVVDEELEDAAV